MEELVAIQIVWGSQRVIKAQGKYAHDRTSDKNIVEEIKQDQTYHRAFYIVCFVIIIYLTDWSFVRGGITNYDLAPCPDCPTGLMTFGSTTYKPSSSRQDVIVWLPEINNIVRYTNCAVLNRKNWKCEDKSTNTTFGFIKGKFWRRSENANRFGWQPVPRWKYLYVYWRNGF